MIGSLRRITYDSEVRPLPGEILGTVSRRTGDWTGTYYLIVSCRAVATTHVRARYAIQAARVATFEADLSVHPMVWNRR